MDNHPFIRQWVGKGGHSDLFPIFLEFKNGPVKPPSPLKFNKTWLNDEGFVNLISSNWIPFDPGNRISTAFQFAENIRRLKVTIKALAVDKRKRVDRELQHIEIELARIYNMDRGGMLNQMEKDMLVRLECR